MDTKVLSLANKYTDEKVKQSGNVSPEQMVNIDKIPQINTDIDQITKDVNVVDKKVINVEKYQANSNVDIEGKVHEDLKGRLLADNVILLDRMNNANYLPYEGEFITANNSYEGRTKDFEVRGKTLQNLIPINSYELNELWFCGTGATPKFDSGYLIQDVNNRYAYLKNQNKLIKPSTDYTIILEIKENTIDGKLSLLSSQETTCFDTLVEILQNTVGILKFKITSKALLNNVTEYLSRGILGSGITSGRIKYRFMILEGDYTTKPIPPYFEGIRSVGEQGKNVEVVSCRKNLIDFTKNFNSMPLVTHQPDNVFIDGKLKVFADRTTGYGKGYYVNVRPNSTYYLNIDYVNQNGIKSGFYGFVMPKQNGKYNSAVTISSSTASKSFTTDAYTTEVFIELAQGNVGYLLINSIQLELGSSSTPYEPYKEHRQSLPLAEPLREIGNVRDTDNTTRIGKFVLNGEEPFIMDPNLANESTVWVGLPENTAVNGFTPIDDVIILNNGMKCNMLPLYNCFNSSNTAEGFCKHRYTTLMFRVLKSKLTEPTIEGFKGWLRTKFNNGTPIEIYYPLKTPIQKESPLEQLRTYDGTTNIFTEGSLITPIVSAKIPSNVPAVVATLNEENTMLKSNVNTLNIENTEVKATNETQDVLIDTTMLATDEMYMMIEPLLNQVPQVLNIKGGSSKMVDMYVAMVIRGLKTIDEVPARYRAEVQAILDKLEK